MSNCKPVFSTRTVEARQVGAAEIQAWAALESRAIEPNAYLSPHFVLPATRYLTPKSDTLVTLIERSGSGLRELVGVGVFDKSQASIRLPVPRLVGYRSLHSPLGGLLLDRDCHVQALEALLRHIRAEMPRSYVLEFSATWADGSLVRAASEAARRGSYESHCRGTIPRAILKPSTCPALLLDKRLASRLRDLNRRKRRLEEGGRVEWRWHREHGIPDDAVEAFLALEHMGWKGENGSSLRARSSHEAFFRDVIRGFASERRALFTVLSLDGKAIASCCTFISGRVGFGFKIGWNPEFRSAAPAKLNELELMRHAHTAGAGIEFFDSGAGPDSYINELWLESRPLTTLSVATHPVGAYALQLADCAMRLRRFIRDKGGLGAATPAVESKVEAPAFEPAGLPLA
jgi:CelD/BcsL family acetyltransferase involved in cellulose biosynthesis